MTNAEWIARARTKARQEGRCGQCRKREPKPDCVTCVECLMAGDDSDDVRRAARIAAGLCLCGAQPRDGWRSCGRCVTRDRRNAQRRRDARKAAP